MANHILVCACDTGMLLFGFVGVLIHVDLDFNSSGAGHYRAWMGGRLKWGGWLDFLIIVIAPAYRFQ